MALLNTLPSDRVRECQDAIQRELARYSCIMVPEIMITGNQITHSVRILARPVIEKDTKSGEG